MSGPVFLADAPRERTAIVLESLVAIFHTPSGITHLLAPPAPEILEVLEAGPADADMILARLAERHALEKDARAAIVARLDELEASGLVRRA